MCFIFFWLSKYLLHISWFWNPFSNFIRNWYYSFSGSNAIFLDLLSTCRLFENILRIGKLLIITCVRYSCKESPIIFQSYHSQNYHYFKWFCWWPWGKRVKYDVPKHNFYILKFFTDYNIDLYKYFRRSHR